MTRPQAPTRQELARFITDQRTLRAFEQLFEAVPSDILELAAQIEDVEASAQIGAETAQAARSDVSRLAGVLERLEALMLTSRQTNLSALERRVSDLEALVLAQR